MARLRNMAAATCVALTAGGAANATSIIGLVVEGGGQPQVHGLDNGNFLGLWGFDNREGANPGADAVAILDAWDITRGFSAGGGAIVGYFNGDNPINPAAEPFDPLAFGFTVDDDARLWGSLWIEWTGGTITYRDPRGRTRSMDSGRITRGGDPLSTAAASPAPVPLPGALGLLGAAVAGMAIFGRRRAAPAA